MSEKLEILEDTLGSHYKSRNEFLFKCPFCNHHKSKLSVNLNLNVFKCWICNTSGGIEYLVKRFASIKNKNKWRLLEQAVDMSSAADIFSQVKEKEKEVIKLPEEYICLARDNLSLNSRTALEYLFKRGITTKDMVFYKIGFCAEGKYRNRIIFPSFDDKGMCNYFIGRTYKNDWLKYKNPPVSRDIIFNDVLIDWEDSVTLVEGIFDSIKTQNSIPLLGSTLRATSNLFKKLVLKQPKVYVGLDDDALSKSLKVINTMIEYGLEVYKMDTSKIEDLGSISREDVDTIKEKSTHMTFENVLQLQWRING